MSNPTPSLDEFLAAYEQNDNEWWYLEGGDHLNLFDEAMDRLKAAEAKVASASHLADEWRGCTERHAPDACGYYAAQLDAVLGRRREESE